MLSSAAIDKTGKGEIDAAKLESMIGQDVGVSDWALIDQRMIDAFADVTFDPYFIHVDPERANKETRFGGTIAHGFLTLSMLSAMAYDSLPDIKGRTVGMNYGFDKIRFLSPVPSGSRVRARFTLSSVSQREEGKWLMALAVVIEREGVDRPALIAEWLTMVLT